MELPPWIEYKEVFLNRFDFCQQEALSRRIVFDSVLGRAEFKEQVDYIKDNMLYRLQSYLYGRVVEGFIVQRPASWFEAWKENAYKRGYLGPWAKRLWPVKYEREEIKAIQAFPDIVQDETHLGRRSIVMRYIKPHPFY
jgi:hypothetical protein